MNEQVFWHPFSTGRLTGPNFFKINVGQYFFTIKPQYLIIARFPHKNIFLPMISSAHAELNCFPTSIVKCLKLSNKLTTDALARLDPRLFSLQHKINKVTFSFKISTPIVKQTSLIRSFLVIIAITLFSSIPCDKFFLQGKHLANERLVLVHNI